MSHPRPYAVQHADGWHVQCGSSFWALNSLTFASDQAYRGEWTNRDGMTDGWRDLATFTEREAHLIAGALRVGSCWGSREGGLARRLRGGRESVQDGVTTALQKST